MLVQITIKTIHGHTHLYFYTHTLVEDKEAEALQT